MEVLQQLTGPIKCDIFGKLVLQCGESGESGVSVESDKSLEEDDIWYP